MSHDFLAHCRNEVPAQAVFSTSQLLQLRRKEDIVRFKHISKISLFNFPEFKLLDK